MQSREVFATDSQISTDLILENRTLAIVDRFVYFVTPAERCAPPV
jgi:hypothetical protein